MDNRSRYRDSDVLMPLIIAALSLVVVCLMAPANAAGREHWTRAVVVDEVAITVHIVSAKELARVMDAKWNLRDLALDDGKGHAKLYRNMETGAWSCHVYLSKPDPQTLAHEARHCHGWIH